jgi:1,4-dihydroxy-2-naphthoate octaprenyltransferase
MIFMWDQLCDFTQYNIEYMMFIVAHTTLILQFAINLHNQICDVYFDIFYKKICIV